MEWIFPNPFHCKQGPGFFFALEVESCVMHTCIMHTWRIAFEVESCKMHTCILHTSRKAAFLSSLNSWPVQMHTGLETTFVPYKQAPFVNDSIRKKNTCVLPETTTSPSCFSQTTLVLGLLFYTPDARGNQYWKMFKTPPPTDDIVVIPPTPQQNMKGNERK